MRIVERNQNPIVGDTINLRLVTFNSNNLANVQVIDGVNIYVLDPSDKTCTDPCGKRLVQTFDSSSIIMDHTGSYLLPLPTTSPMYTISGYEDVWTVLFDVNDPEPANITNKFNLYPNLWYTQTTPVVYGFGFFFQPNQIRHGSIKWLNIRIEPNVPTATDLQRYYTNIAISADLRIFIEQVCGPCTNPEKDLRMIVDGEHIHVRDKVFGAFKLDTRDMDCGIYNVWFSLEYAGTVDISPKNQLQII